jgi:hypothetical protein
VGTAVAALGTVSQGFSEGRIERRLQRKGIMHSKCACAAESAVGVHDLVDPRDGALPQGIETVDIRISSGHHEELFLLLGRAYYGRDGDADVRRLRAADSQRPWLATTELDGGVNYTNVFLLSRYIKENLGEQNVVRETLMDTKAAWTTH